MRGRDRVFKAGAIQHIYQDTVDGSLIFYSARDYLVLFTLISVAARKYHVQILGICFMPDHIHLLVIASSRQTLSRFVCHYTSRFAKLYNRTVFRSGQFFRHSFGSALKIDDKKCRSAIAYLYNNPVEKQLATDVESGRWNYLRYAQSSHPFSTALDQSHASKAMRRAIEEVRACRKADEPLNYTQIERMTKDLTVLFPHVL